MPDALRWGIPALLIVGSGRSLGGSIVPPVLWLAALGDASYSLYLIHPFILRPFRNVWIILVGGALPLAAYVVVVLWSRPSVASCDLSLGRAAPAALGASPQHGTSAPPMRAGRTGAGAPLTPIPRRVRLRFSPAGFSLVLAHDDIGVGRHEVPADPGRQRVEGMVGLLQARHAVEIAMPQKRWIWTSLKPARFSIGPAGERLPRTSYRRRGISDRRRHRAEPETARARWRARPSPAGHG
jgi:hypothetical protein